MRKLQAADRLARRLHNERVDRRRPVAGGAALAAGSAATTRLGRRRRRADLDRRDDLLVFGIVRAADHRFGDPAALVTMPAVLTLLALFVAVERRVAQPVLPLRLFASAGRCGALVARGCFVGAIVGFFFTAQLMQDLVGCTPLEAGLGFPPMTLAMFAATLAVPALTRRIGNAALLCLALALIVAELLWLSAAGAEATCWADLAAPMLLIGFGKGGALGSLTVAGVAGVESLDQGAASGLVNVAHQLGGSLGLAVLVAVFAKAGGGSLAGGLAAVTLGEAALMGFALALSLAPVWPAERRRAA